MAAALFAFLAAAIAGMGARDQLLVAALTARGGRRWAVLPILLCAAWLSTFAAVWAAGLIAGELNNRAGLLLSALALTLAALELAILAPRPVPEEPTRSLGAATIVLFATQLTDATRFLIFAIAIAAEAPQQALLGGVLGSAMVVAAGWLGGADLLQLRLRPARRALGAVLVLVAAWLVWQVTLP